VKSDKMKAAVAAAARIQKPHSQIAEGAGLGGRLFGGDIASVNNVACEA
jgi:hypothetical protein